jgi:hypothetical protein
VAKLEIVFLCNAMKIIPKPTARFIF